MAKEYEVIKIDQLLRASNAGGTEPFFRHTFRTRGGTILTVDIDEANFTPEKAAPILAARATNADNIKTL